MGARLLARVLPWLVGVVAGVLALGPALGPGHVLRYDMLFVPDLSLPTVLAGADGFPRAIPSDAVVAALSLLLPGDVVQSLALLAVFAVGGAGAFRLLVRLVCDGPAAPGCGRVPGAVLAAGAGAGVLYVWNPFVAERLLLGQWAMLLGYAGLPWVLWAVVRLASARPVAGLAGVVCSLVPAAIGGFSSVVLSALTVGPQALAGPRRLRNAGLFAAGLAVVSLPWLLPAAVPDQRRRHRFRGGRGLRAALGHPLRGGGVPADARRGVELGRGAARLRRTGDRDGPVAGVRGVPGGLGLVVTAEPPCGGGRVVGVGGAGVRCRAPRGVRAGA